MSFLYRPSRRVFASVVLLLLGFGLCACTGNKSGRISVAVTIPPLQNWAEQLAGGRVDIVCAVPDGGNPESYDLPPSAMVGLSKCSLYFSCGYLGFERSWLGKLSENNPELQIVDLSEGSELLYGTHHHEEGHHHDGEAYPDPHIWCSPRLARRMVEMMYRSLTEIDPDGASTYAENYARIDRRFAQLDSVLTDKLRPFKGKAFAVYHPTLSYWLPITAFANLRSNPMENLRRRNICGRWSIRHVVREWKSSLYSGSLIPGRPKLSLGGRLSY